MAKNWPNSILERSSLQLPNFLFNGLSMNNFKDRRVFDVSLVTGHRDLYDHRSDFSRPFIGKLSRAVQQATRTIRCLRATPPGRLHFTLRAVYGDRPVNFVKATSTHRRQKRYRQVLRYVRQEKVRAVIWKGFTLTKNDVLILEGRAQGSWLTRLRRKIDRSDRNHPTFPASNYCHVVLARSTRRLNSTERSNLLQWLQKNPFGNPIRMTIRHPKLLATRNHFGTQYDPLIQQEIDQKKQQGLGGRS